MYLSFWLGQKKKIVRCRAQEEETLLLIGLMLDTPGDLSRRWRHWKASLMGLETHSVMERY